VNGGGVESESALSASIARSDFTEDTAVFSDGWIVFNTAATGNTSGLPIIGQSFIRASNGAVNYGFGYNNKVTR